MPCISILYHSVRMFIADAVSLNEYLPMNAEGFHIDRRVTFDEDYANKMKQSQVHTTDSNIG